MKTGYLEKRIGEKSTRQNLPESFKWQRRYFVLSEAKGQLYYFNKEEDVPNYKGKIDISQCKVGPVPLGRSCRNCTPWAAPPQRSGRSPCVVLPAAPSAPVMRAASAPPLGHP